MRVLIRPAAQVTCCSPSYPDQLIHLQASLPSSVKAVVVEVKVVHAEPQASRIVMLLQEVVM